MSRRAVAGIVIVFALALWAALAAPAGAFSVQFGNPAFGLSATIDVTQPAANQLKFVVTNTTKLGATTGSANRILLLDTSCDYPVVTSDLSAACRLLASFGWANTAITQSITGGTATIALGSTGRGKIGPTTTNYGAGDDWSGEWGYANNFSPNGIGTFDFITTNTSGTTADKGGGVFGGANRDSTTGLDGPQGGILSQQWTETDGLGFVRDTLEFVITFSSSLSAGDLTALQNADWFVEFGSGTRGIFNGQEFGAPEPATGLMLLAGVLALAGARRMRRVALPGA